MSFLVRRDSCYSGSAFRIVRVCLRSFLVPSFSSACLFTAFASEPPGAGEKQSSKHCLPERPASREWLCAPACAERDTEINHRLSAAKRRALRISRNVMSSHLPQGMPAQSHEPGCRKRTRSRNNEMLVQRLSIRRGPSGISYRLAVRTKTSDQDL